MLQDNQKPKAIKEKLLSFLENDNPFIYTKNIIDTQVDEIEFTKKYLIQNLKNHFSEEILSGLIIKGPGDVALPRFEFLNSISITDIVFIKNSQKIISIEVKIIDSVSNRNQNISTAIGQGIIQSLGKYKYSVIYILDLGKGDFDTDIRSLKEKLSNMDVSLIYKKDK